MAGKDKKGQVKLGVVKAPKRGDSTIPSLSDVLEQGIDLVSHINHQNDHTRAWVENARTVLAGLDEDEENGGHDGKGGSES